jgi:hypothetical protein
MGACVLLTQSIQDFGRRYELMEKYPQLRQDFPKWR